MKMVIRGLQVLTVLIALVGTVGLVKATGRKEPPRDALMIDSTLLNYLEQVAETSHVETARCMTGYFSNDSTFNINGVFETPWLVTRQDSTGVTFHMDKCPRGAVAWWHVHPWIVIRKWSQDQNVSPWNWCSLSALDRTNQLYPLAIVSIRKGMTCVFYVAADGTYHQVPLDR